jgi:hypothetical protein
MLTMLLFYSHCGVNNICTLDHYKIGRHWWNDNGVLLSLSPFSIPLKSHCTIWFKEGSSRWRCWLRFIDRIQRKRTRGRGREGGQEGWEESRRERERERERERARDMICTEERKMKERKEGTPSSSGRGRERRAWLRTVGRNKRRSVEKRLSIAPHCVLCSERVFK